MALTGAIIKRKIKPVAEEEFKRLMRGALSRTAHADGFISGETLQAIDDPTVHVTISQWRGLAS